MTQQQAVVKAGSGVSLAVWNNLENARQDTYRSSTLAAVARALNWTVDSLDRIHAGDEPLENGDSVPVVQAILEDPLLDDRSKQILLGTYKTLVSNRSDDGEALS